jgi:hypothetical protein
MEQITGSRIMVGRMEIKFAGRTQRGSANIKALSNLQNASVEVDEKNW